MPDDINEVNARLLDIYNMSVSDLNKFIKDGNFVISESVDFTKITIGELPGEWVLTHDEPNPKHGTNEVSLYIMPTNIYTTEIWNIGLFNIGRAAGLGSRACRRWTYNKHKFKHLNIKHLTKVSYILKDSNLVKAFIAFTPEFTPTEYREWKKQYNIDNDPEVSKWFGINKNRLRSFLLQLVSKKVVAEIMKEIKSK